MTRKDYCKIAAILADPTLKLQDSKRTALVSRFVDVLAADNPRFDAERFTAACWEDKA